MMRPVRTSSVVLCALNEKFTEAAVLCHFVDAGPRCYGYYDQPRHHFAVYRTLFLSDLTKSMGGSVSVNDNSTGDSQHISYHLLPLLFFLVAALLKRLARLWNLKVEWMVISSEHLRAAVSCHISFVEAS